MKNQDITIQLNNILSDFYKVFGYLPLPREYIIKLIIRGIDRNTIFTMGTDAQGHYKNVIKNKYYNLYYE